MQQSYDVENGLDALIKRISALKAKVDRPIIVNIAGGSGSGKSGIVAAHAARSFAGESILITIDDYLKGNKFLSAEIAKGRDLNFDHPEHFDIELLAGQLRELKDSKAIDKPVFSFKAQERVGSEKVEPANVIIVEGIYALHEQVAKLADVRVFVDTSPHGRTARRLARDLKRTAWTPSFIIEYMGTVLERMYSQHVAPTKGFADIMIVNEFTPLKETLVWEHREVQLKFGVGKRFRLPDALDAQLVSQSMQEDNYYSSSSADLKGSDEMVRIRSEGGQKIFTYKGPRLGSDFITRANITFPIDAKAEAGIRSLYGRHILSIMKERLVYKTGTGMDLCIDQNVTKSEGEKIRILGDFLNARVPFGKEQSLRELQKSLGVDDSTLVDESYYNM